MNELAIFNNPEFGDIRTLEDSKGEVMFCGKDVADALGYKDTRHAVSSYCRYGVKCPVPHPQSPDKTIEMTFIPESDVYRLAFGSKLESAERFTDWVVEEVIPSIRKTGGYTAKPTNPIQSMNAEARLLNAKARQAQIMLNFARLELSTASKELLAANAMQVMTGKQVLPLPETAKTYTAGEIGKMLGVSGNKIGRIANLHGIKTDEYGIMVLDTAPNGKQIPTFRYNDKAVDVFRELLTD